MTRRRALVLIQGELGKKPTGPEIRGWELARGLARDHDVTVLARVDGEQEREGIAVAPMSRGRLTAAAREHDVVVGAVLPPYLLMSLVRRPVLRVADLYDPVELEFGDLTAWNDRRDALILRAARTLHLRHSDVVLCASQAQRARLDEDLRALGIAKHPEILTVPMGLEPPPPEPTHRPLREHFPAIGAEDPVVLWWGSVWRWLDAPTAIEAIARLARTRPNVRLVITAGRPPNASTGPVNATEEAREVARRAGVLDRNVLFLDEWVPFADRHAYLRDADLGITLHGDTAEAPLAARTRYMDCVWASLPSVLARGDEMADRFAAAGAARLVTPGDVAGIAQTIDMMLNDRAGLDAARDACRALARELQWDAVVAPVSRQVGEAELAPRPAAEVAALGRAVARYYRRRVTQRALSPVLSPLTTKEAA